MAERPPRKVAFLLVPGFALMSFASAIEPLRAANHLSGKELYRWFAVVPRGDMAEPSVGFPFQADATVGDTGAAHMVVVCAGGNPARFKDRQSLVWLRRQGRAGALMAGVSGGSYLLARAGLLNGRRCTIHWEHLGAFREEFPHLDIARTLFEIDRDRLTCAGGTAALDMMHAVIARDHGEDLAAAVHAWFLQSEVRGGSDRQGMRPEERWGARNAHLAAALEVMEQDAESILSMPDVAAAAGISVRQLGRLFRAQLGATFSTHRQGLKLDRARRLLRQTSMPILAVAIACGFQSASHFSRAYKKRFRESPSVSRRGGGTLPAAPGCPSLRNTESDMPDERVFRNIENLTREEHELFAKQAAREATDADNARLKDIQVMLDQCWDLLRQRRAKRDAGQNPDEATVRSSRTVEGYQG
ncbi:transcriptional regulator, AraC family with amidase-like domain [Arboricoccus pini]|uniref:Transcriptional regulator, AraC family with amidase-like domain n=1 Tax=Arboricoccus pini TaxID=1963835 RepID=A0A212RIA7_9PROT|nr:DUF2630 family protein [Arboricoccus pini]SNB72153.1 transcriptional regulator, AraC family with amidase-like domain [Arboricoccus pini]